MISIATKLSRIARTTQVAFSLYNSPTPHFLSLQSSRCFSTNQEFKINPVAVQTINYAYSFARSLKTDDSYAQGLLILEQCESNQTDDISKGLVFLAMSKLLSERGNVDDAVEKLYKCLELNTQSMHEGVWIAAIESLMGLRLENGEDTAVSVGLDSSLLLDGLTKDLEAHLKALKGLVELVRGNPTSSEPYFEEARNRISSASFAGLSYAEFLHTMRSFSVAKELYQKVIQGVPENKEFCDPDNLTAGSIAILPCAADLSIAATCSLGQLEAHMGNFADSEEILTRALTKAEEHYGSHHPKVGVVLTCIALMFRYKATVEHSSSLMIQEGLYRRAIEVLKAPPLETAVTETNACRRDVIALARGGYAETLCVQQNRKAEGMRIKSWAESAWMNKRLSLAEALDISKPSSKVPVIDLRISRAL